MAKLAMWKSIPAVLVTRCKYPLLLNRKTWLSNSSRLISLALCPSSFNRENKRVIECERPYIAKVHSFNIIKSPCVKFSSSVLNDKQCCWNCHESLSPTHAFCGHCNSLQPLNPDHTHFQVLGIERNFNIDTRALVKIFRKLQAQFHPDRYSTKSEVCTVLTWLHQQ